MQQREESLALQKAAYAEGTTTTHVDLRR